MLLAVVQRRRQGALEIGGMIDGIGGYLGHLAEQKVGALLSVE